MYEIWCGLSRLAHFLQRFVGSDFLSNVGYLTIIPLIPFALDALEIPV